MTTQRTQARIPWYVRDDDGEGGWHLVCAAMRQLEQHDVDADSAAAWALFSDFIRSTALDQEVYGEYLLEGGESALGPMWAAYRCGWEDRETWAALTPGGAAPQETGR